MKYVALLLLVLTYSANGKPVTEQPEIISPNAPTVVTDYSSVAKSEPHEIPLAPTPSKIPEVAAKDNVKELPAPVAPVVAQINATPETEAKKVTEESGLDAKKIPQDVSSASSETSSSEEQPTKVIETSHSVQDVGKSEEIAKSVAEVSLEKTEEKKIDQVAVPSETPKEAVPSEAPKEANSQVNAVSVDEPKSSDLKSQVESVGETNKPEKVQIVPTSLDAGKSEIPALVPEVTQPHTEIVKESSEKVAEEKITEQKKIQSSEELSSEEVKSEEQKLLPSATPAKLESSEETKPEKSAEKSSEELKPEPVTPEKLPLPEPIKPAEPESPKTEVKPAEEPKPILKPAEELKQQPQALEKPAEEQKSEYEQKKDKVKREAGKEKYEEKKTNDGFVKKEEYKKIKTDGKQKGGVDVIKPSPVSELSDESVSSEEINQPLNIKQNESKSSEESVERNKS